MPEAVAVAAPAPEPVPSGPAPRVPGVAPIKAEFIIPRGTAPRPANDDAAESHTAPGGRSSSRDAPANDVSTSSEPNGGGKRQKKGGQNTKRRFKKVGEQLDMCNNFVRHGVCDRVDGCRFSHDLVAYLATKPRDLVFPRPPLDSAHGSVQELEGEAKEAYLSSTYSLEAPFVRWEVRGDEGEADEAGGDSKAPRPVAHSFDRDTYCPIWDAQKRHARNHDAPAARACTAGWKCRYLGAHIHETVEGETSAYCLGTVGGFALDELTGYKGEKPPLQFAPNESNHAESQRVRLLAKKRYPLPLTDAVLAKLEVEEKLPQDAPVTRGPVVIDAEQARRDYAAKAAEMEARAQGPKGRGKRPFAADDDDDLDAMMNASRVAAPPPPATTTTMTEKVEVDVARVRAAEKRRLNWKHGELYLAPLTTTGNLPFRRICSSFGSDIHCGEMGLADSYMAGRNTEWNLVQRWEGERWFGTQLCGGKPNLLIPTAEALAAEVGNGLDFVDVNCGCPIDMVFNRGAGSALLDHHTRLGRIVRGMSAVLGEVPVTVKLRTGTTAKNTTHKMFPQLQTEWGVGAVTLHGRSRKQRYSKLADWEYIGECAKALRESVREHNEEAKYADEEELAPIPIYGNGDVYDWRVYYENLKRTGVDGEMVARGALIKPWVFTEIKERRDWDISSRERLDIVRQFAHYGLTHWGSDSQGVNLTRRFLCEALSFFHRYVPVGLLEHLPAAMNDRPPAYRGRDDLETLLASDDSRDWVRISEMFLGKAPAEWSFTPKHKSNSYSDGGPEQQG